MATHVKLYKAHYVILEKTLEGLPVGDEQSFRYHHLLLQLQSIDLVQLQQLTAITIWKATPEGRAKLSDYEFQRKTQRNALINGCLIALFTFLLSNGSKIFDAMTMIVEFVTGYFG